MEPGVSSYLRVDRTASLALTTAWQQVLFTGTSPQNVNTLPKVAGVPMVRYDDATGLFLFTEQNTGIARNYVIQFGISAQTTLVTTRANLQYQFEIPSGNGYATALQFPFPVTAKAGDLMEATVIQSATFSRQETQPIYTNPQLLANGLKLNVRLSNSLITLGSCTTSDIFLLIYPSSIQ